MTAAKTAPTARGIGGLEAAVVVRVEETTRLPAAHEFPSHRPANMRRQLLTLGLDLGAPIVLYYGLSAAGVSNLVAHCLAPKARTRCSLAREVGLSGMGHSHPKIAVTWSNAKASSGRTTREVAPCHCSGGCDILGVLERVAFRPPS